MISKPHPHKLEVFPYHIPFLGYNYSLNIATSVFKMMTPKFLPRYLYLISNQLTAPHVTSPEGMPQISVTCVQSALPISFLLFIFHLDNGTTQYLSSLLATYLLKPETYTTHSVCFCHSPKAISSLNSIIFDFLTSL